MKLFAIYIGGELAGANIELHDIRFILAENIEATYPIIRKQWWGIPNSLHIDCWCELIRADGYSITLQREPSTNANKLFYVNLGGYDPEHFTEMHKNVFVVAETEPKAKIKALKQVRHWNTFHKDEMYEAEQSFCIDDTCGEQAWFIHLEKIDDESPAPFTCSYKRLKA